MFRLPYGERVDPMEEKRQARENTISSVITFAILCAAIRVGKYSCIIFWKHIILFCKTAETAQTMIAQLLLWASL